MSKPPKAKEPKKAKKDPKPPGDTDVRLEQDGDLWNVYNGKKILYRGSEEAATAFYNDLIADPPKDQEWFMIGVEKNQSHELLAYLQIGYEPYAVDRHRHWLRKAVK